MKKLSISVMAHPKRAEHFSYLNRCLGDVPFSIDEGIGIWENCKRAWRLRDPEAKWHVVIQDDAIVCDNFRERAEKVIDEAEKRGDKAISFFWGTRKLLQATSKRGLIAGYCESGWIHWGVSICLPGELVEEMIAFGDKMHIKQDDTRISTFIKSKGYKVYYPMPSLVEHRKGPSLVGDGDARQAYSFIDNVK